MRISEARLSSWYVRPYYLSLMGANALWKGGELAPHLQRAAARLSTEDIRRLLGPSWRETVVGAWLALIKNDPALAADLHRALRESRGSLTSPALLVAVLHLPTDETASSIEEYYRNDLANEWGGAETALAAAAVHAERSGSQSCLPLPESEAREELDDLLTFAEHLRTSRRAGLVSHGLWHLRLIREMRSDD